VSLPPAKWEEALSLPATALDSPRGPAVSLLMSMFWGARNDGLREPFLARLDPTLLTSGWTQTADGWRLPLWHAPAPAGSRGEPVILAADLGLNARCFDLHSDRSLVRHLHTRGFEVFVFCHRGHRDAVPPQHRPQVDFDAIVAHDVPAAIATVKAQTGAERVHWIGHGFGGQCLVGHMANDGDRDLSASALISSPVTFPSLKTTARRAAAIANVLPSTWRLPVDKVQRLLMVGGRHTDIADRTQRIEGPMARALLLDGAAPLALGLLQQMAQWHATGQLVDRHNRFDYLAGLSGRETPVLVIGSPDDQRCQPHQAEPAAEALTHSDWWCLDEGWGHLDLIAGADAARTVFPRITDWIEMHRGACWTTG
jgi:predicted alpha/beta hydrolase